MLSRQFLFQLWHPRFRAVELDDIESAFNAAFPNVADFDYATRFQFAVSRLEATEGRSDVMLIAELAERLSLVLGRNVTAGHVEARISVSAGDPQTSH